MASRAVVDLAEPGASEFTKTHMTRITNNNVIAQWLTGGRAHAARTNSLTQSVSPSLSLCDLAVQDREPQATNKACEAHRQRMGYSKLQLDCF